MLPSHGRVPSAEERSGARIANRCRKSRGSEPTRIRRCARTARGLGRSAHPLPECAPGPWWQAAVSLVGPCSPYHPQSPVPAKAGGVRFEGVSAAKQPPELTLDVGWRQKPSLAGRQRPSPLPGDVAARLDSRAGASAWRASRHCPPGRSRLTNLALGLPGCRLGLRGAWPRPDRHSLSGLK
jgi:hypothetical protein